MPDRTSNGRETIQGMYLLWRQFFVVVKVPNARHQRIIHFSAFARRRPGNLYLGTIPQGSALALWDIFHLLVVLVQALAGARRELCNGQCRLIHTASPQCWTPDPTSPPRPGNRIGLCWMSAKIGPFSCSCGQRSARSYPSTVSCLFVSTHLSSPDEERHRCPSATHVASRGSPINQYFACFSMSN